MKKAIVRTFICIALLFLLLLTYTSLQIFTQLDSTADHTTKTVIILGAKVKPDESLSLALKYRLDAALDYAQQQPDLRFIVTGGKGPDEPISESLAMQRYLIENGIKEENIIMEDQSISTYENLQNAASFLNENETKVTIISSDFHLARATFLAKQVGLEADTVAAPTPKSIYTTSMIREHAALMKTYLFRK